MVCRFWQNVKSSVGKFEESFKNWKNPRIMSSHVSKKMEKLPDLIKDNSDPNNENDESTPIFPQEVIIEILSRLPLKYLSQVQLVCKEWQAIIHDHYFIEKHLGRSSIVKHFHNVNVVKTRSDLNSQPILDSFYCLDGCDGLLLMRNNYSDKYLIWNPAICRVLELPDPHEGSYGFSFSFVPTTRNYRIVSIYKDKESGKDGCEVLTPGHSKTWRRLAFPDIVTHMEIEKEVSVVSAGGAVHCVLKTKVSEEMIVGIVTLNLETESFTVSHLPNGLFRDVKAVLELDWDGKLAFADIVGENLQWVELEDYKNQRWCEKKIISLSFLKDIPLIRDNGVKGNVFPLFNRQGDLWFWLKKEKIFAYTIKTGKIKDIEPSKNFALKSILYPYKPSLVAFKDMQPATHLEKFCPRFRSA